MRNCFVILFLIGLACKSKAQYVAVNDTPKYKIVHQDTINVTGIVYDYLNKPVKYLRFTSRNKEIKYSGYFIYTQTDNDGKFILNGALPNDTLTYYWDKQKCQLLVRGSRFVTLRLPPITQITLNDTVKVSAKRAVKKLPPTFKVITNPQVFDYYGITGGMPLYMRPAPGEFVAQVQSKIIYPEMAINNNIEGDVEIGFTIEMDGYIDDFKILRGIGYGCEKAVIDAIRHSVKWQPGILDGMPLTGKSSVTISFKLTD
jgi:TonB family protein